MPEVHRYQVVTMLSMAGATIGYDPHGPDVVMASDFDNATRLFLDAAERCIASERREKELQQRLTAADERADELEGLLNRAIELLRGAHTGDLFGPDDWEIIDEFLAGSALKPADVFVDPLKSCNVCGDEHICQGCGSKGWTANCKECVPY
ncbi:hypothetical protein [Pseudomonas veronii]